MATINLNEKTLLAIKPSNNGKQENYFDENQTGFGVYVTKAGKKNYFVKGTCNSKQVMFTMGECSGFDSVKEARHQAATILQGMREGINPQKEKQKRKLAEDAQLKAVEADKKKDITLREVYQTMLEVRAAKLKPRTVGTYEQLTGYYLKDWLDRPMRSITDDEVVNHFSSISQKGKVSANNAFRAFRAIWNFGNVYHKGIFGDNPVKRLSGLKIWNTVAVRDREIPSKMMQAWFDAIMKWETPATRDYLLLLLFTGMRRSEAAALSWQNINFMEETLRVNDTKNGKPLVLPISSFPMALLEYRHKNCYENEYVFPGTGKSGHIVEPKRAISFVTAETGIDFTCHDLRRTLSSLCLDLLIHPYITDALINHVTGGKADVTRGYSVVTTERMRQPAQQICDRIMELCAGIVTDDDRKKKKAELQISEQGLTIVAKELPQPEQPKQVQPKKK